MFNWNYDFRGLESLMVKQRCSNRDSWSSIWGITCWFTAGGKDSSVGMVGNIWNPFLVTELLQQGWTTNISQRVPPVKKQIFKLMSLWGTFSFNLPQYSKQFCSKQSFKFDKPKFFFIVLLLETAIFHIMYLDYTFLSCYSSRSFPPPP